MRREFTKQNLELLVEALDDRLAYYQPHVDGMGASIVFGDKTEMSLRWGYGNYCTTRDNPTGPRMTVEVAAFTCFGNIVRLDETSDVLGWQDWESVCALASVFDQREW